MAPNPEKAFMQPNIADVKIELNIILHHAMAAMRVASDIKSIDSSH